MQEESLRKAPRRVELARLQLLPQELGVRRRSSGPANGVEKGEGGPERMHSAVPSGALSAASSSASRRDRASATVLRRPGRYSTVKSKPNSLLIH